MKIKKNFILLCILSILSAESPFGTKLFAKELKGTELCQDIFDFLRTSRFNPRTQNIYNSQQNDFPYNIYVEFENEKQTKAHSDDQKKDILFVFRAEDAVNNKEPLKKFLSFLKNSSKDLQLNTTVLFSYGDEHQFYSIMQKSKIPPIFGTETFIENYYTQSDYTAIYVDFNNEKNEILASANGKISPGNLLRISLNSFLDSKINFKDSMIFLSQIYKISIKSDTILDLFFSRDIPAIKLSFSDSENPDNILLCLEHIFEKLSAQQDSEWNWEQHFILYKSLGNYHMISEKSILSSVIIVIAVILLFIFVFGYINSFIKFEAWKNIRYIWYAAPIIFLLIILGFYAGRGFFNLFSPKTAYGKIFLLFWLQLFFTVIFVSAFYIILSFYNHKFSDRSVDYLILLSTFINQSIFGCIDISLYPMFLVIFSAAFFTIFFRKFFSHFYLFLILIILLFPYCNKFLSSFDGNQTALFFETRKTYYFITSLVLTPILLLYLRLLIRFRQKRGKKKELVLFIISYSVLILLIQTMVCIISIPFRNKSLNKKQAPVYTSVSEQNVFLTHSDSKIFDDIVRTINIKTAMPAEICTVLIFSPTNQPVQYSEYDFEPLNATSSYFAVPKNPPEKFSFTFGTIKEPCFVKITAIFETEVDNEYILEERIFSVSEDE